MNKQDKRTLPSGVLSLLPLEQALTAAEREAPARPPRPVRDPNERRALRLVEQIKHPRLISWAGLKIEPPQPVFTALREMAGSDAR